MSYRERERGGDGERGFYNIDTERERRSFYHDYGLCVLRLLSVSVIIVPPLLVALSQLQEDSSICW